ncbi:segregation and condensation protein A [Bifidobacterium pluvialisilvae]|uniref:segregation and condensation protein A n=1 Tax=Bifidobacterium pluvialisilvae TaxID=2834436 RepID=UPI001F41DCD3|nr:ScpA family protein [Bifidobacterium pluvialisilvae]
MRPQDRPGPPSGTGMRPGSGFTVTLDAYQGPFDVLLDMLAGRRLELTEVSLAVITDEFMRHIDAMDLERNMDEASAFLDVAAVLVEAKSAAILPADGDGEGDGHDMEALRERDLLFARLLQYKAFKQAGMDFRARIAENTGRVAHPGYAGDDIAAMLPPLTWTTSLQTLAALAAHALSNAPADEVSVEQLHVPLVDLRRQAAIVRDRLRALPHGGATTFAALTADTTSNMEIAARFLAILAFFRQGSVQIRQSRPYAELHLRWASDESAIPTNGGIGDIAVGIAPDAPTIEERDFA